MRPSRKRFLQWAIRGKYHGGNLASTSAYLKRSFQKQKFTPASLIEFGAYLALYDREYVKYSPVVVDTIHLGDRLETSLADACYLTGEVDRVELTDSGYAVWLFDVERVAWQAQLRMPLIQAAYAAQLGAPTSEVRVGFYFFKEGVHESECYRDGDIRSASKEAARIAAVLTGE